MWREFPGGPDRRVPQEGCAHRALRADAAAAVRLDPDPRRQRSQSALLRQVVRLPAVRRAVREACSAPTASCVLNALLLALAAWCGYVFLAARSRPAIAALLPARSSWPRWCRSTTCGLRRSCSTSRSASWPTSAGCTRRSRRRLSAARRSRWLFGAASDVLAGADPRSGHVLEGLQRAALSARGRCGCCGSGAGATRRVASAAFGGDGGRAVRDQHGDHGRVELSGRGAQHVQLRVPVPDAARPGLRSAQEQVAQRGADRDDLQSGRVLDQPRPQPRLHLRRAATAASSRISSRPRSRWARCWSASGGGPVGRRSRCAAALAQPLVFAVMTPYTWLGGGGSVGNRYFMGAYGAFLFLLPPISSAARGADALAGRQPVRRAAGPQPVLTSFYPGRYAAHGPLRWFPVELTLVYDWPINTDESRVRNLVRGQPGSEGSRLPDLLLRLQRLRAGDGQELLGEGRDPGGVPDQDRPPDETAGADASRPACRPTSS